MVAEPLRAAALAGVLLAAAHLCAPARAAAPPAEVPTVEKPSVLKRTDPTHVWNDGTTPRPLWEERSLRADFSPSVVGKTAVLRTSTGPLKDVSSALQSVVFRDEGGRARALPGGVLVVFAAPLDDAAATAALAAQGVPDARRLGDRMWLVPAAAGLPSLELANRLAATGAFAAAQPNWWVERTRK